MSTYLGNVYSPNDRAWMNDITRGGPGCGLFLEWQTSTLNVELPFLFTQKSLILEDMYMPRTLCSLSNLSSLPLSTTRLLVMGSPSCSSWTPPKFALLQPQSLFPSLHAAHARSQDHTTDTLSSYGQSI